MLKSGAIATCILPDVGFNSGTVPYLKGEFSNEAIVKYLKYLSIELQEDWQIMS